ncbi:MAG TPA: hypothetical protein VGE77_05510 [Nocardioides sp.]
MTTSTHVGEFDPPPLRVELGPDAFDELVDSLAVADDAPALRDRLASLPRLD